MTLAEYIQVSIDIYSNSHVLFHPLFFTQVAGAYSKSWCYRENAILDVYKMLLDLSPNTPKEELRNMIRAAVFLVKRSLMDKVSSVSLLL